MKKEFLKLSVSTDNDCFYWNINDRQWYSNLCPDIKYSCGFKINIFQEDADENEESVGFIKGNYFNIMGMLDNDIDLLDVFDAISQEIYDAFTAISYDDGTINHELLGYTNPNVFLIRRLYIEQKFRKQSIGKNILRVLSDVLEYSRNIEVGNFILLPNAMEKNEKGEVVSVEEGNKKRNLDERLKRFYEGLGFKNIQNSDHMYFNNEYIMK